MGSHTSDSEAKESQSQPEIDEEYLKHLLEDGSKVRADSDGEMEVPEWYDEELFKKAQYYFQENKFAMFVGMLCGLISVLSIPTILKVLVCTGKSSTSLTAYRRYIKTIFHMISWYTYDLKPNSKSWDSLQAVRKMHSFSSGFSEKSNCGMITQKDMALTQFGFMGFVILKPDDMGIFGGTEFAKAIIHFWRVIGHMIGIRDEYNVCTAGVDETKSRLNALLIRVYRPCLTNATDEFCRMTQAFIDGLWSFNPIITTEAYLYFTRRLAGCVGHKYLDSDVVEKPVDGGEEELVYKTFTGYNRYLIFSKVMLHKCLLRYNLLRAYFNFQITLSEFLIYYFPFLAFHRFGFQKAYVRIFKRAKSHHS